MTSLRSVSLALIPLFIICFCIVEAQTPADSVTITFRAYRASSPTVYLPGQFNGWVITAGSASQMTFSATDGCWAKKYVFKIHDPADSRRTLGDSVFQYKFNAGGNSSGWYSDPLNPESNPADNGNSIVRLKKLFWFETAPARSGNQVTSVSAGLVHDNAAAITSIALITGETESGATTTDVTMGYDSSSSYLSYIPMTPIPGSNFIRLIAINSRGDSAVTTIAARNIYNTPYLTNPDLAIGYVDSCAKLWSHAIDTVYGGVYTNVDRTGHVITSAGLNKNVVALSRDAYGFTRAFMLTGNENYLAVARNCLRFMYQHHWDSLYGGWHSTIDRFGNATNPTEDKTAFDQHYALLGIEAFCEATRDTLDWSWLMKGYDNSEARLWDTSAQNFGYYDHGSYNWSTVTGKSFNATVDAITTHALGLYLMTGEDRYRVHLLQLGSNILDHLVYSMNSQAIGFVEAYNTDWTWTNSSANYNTRTLMGHVLKTAWCLGRIQQLLPNPSYLPAAEQLAGSVLTKGYDSEFGGPYKDYDRVTGQMLMYGSADTGKAWWQMEQAVTGGLMLYNLTGNSSYLRMAQGTLGFFMNYFVDHTYGDVYSDISRYGVNTGGTDKGNSAKAAYHSTETGYYTYLYGKLILLGQPATLHYMFNPDSIDRTIRMNPIDLAADKYRIGEVRMNGIIYTDFDAANRLLHLPSGTGGHFTVIYEPAATPARTVTVAARSGWNMVSVAVHPADNRASVLVPAASSSAFTYAGKYVPKDSLLPGVGYWVKFANSTSFSISGLPVALDTVPVAKGWNMIGSLTDSVAVASIGSVPPGLVTSSFFTYDSAYRSVTTLVPGTGTWVKVNNPGSLILSAAALKATAQNVIRIVNQGELPPSPPIDASAGTPATELRYSLKENFPNPFNPETEISYVIRQSSLVSLRIYDVLGREVATLVDETKGPGTYSVKWNAANQPSGVYYYRLTAGEFTDVKRMLLIK